jgi:hypothetical protein
MSIFLSIGAAFERRFLRKKKSNYGQTIFTNILIRNTKETRNKLYHADGDCKLCSIIRIL